MIKNTTFNRRTLGALGWPLLLENISVFCRSELGRAEVKGLSPRINDSQRQLRRQQLEELMDLDNRGVERPPLCQFADITEALSLLERESVLDIEELKAIGQISYLATRLTEWRDSLPEFMTGLKSLLADLRSLNSLRRAIDAVIAEDGTIKDRASPDLSRLRGHHRECSRGVEHTLDELVYNLNQKGLLNDTYYTIRSGRYVLPVKSERRSEVGGILHDLSQTKKTAFIEPEVVIRFGNQLVALDGEIAEEERRIMAMLSQEAARYADDLALSLEAATKLDALWAVSSYFVRYQATFAAIGEPGEPVILRRLRHPLLLDNSTRVVANDLRLDDPGAALVVTGPNAGGKSVLLKSVGLAALCQQAGLPFTYAEGSQLPLWTDILVSIGDEQDLNTGHSTFSAHMAGISGALKEVAANEGATLVLLDELLADTEPVQGAALARACIEGFIDGGAKVMVTTHYTTLKMVAEEDARFVNIAMGFDMENGRPTYQLSQGSSGSSNPLLVAAAVGLDSAVIARAKELAGPEHGQIEQQLERLGQKQRHLDELTAKMAELKERLMDERQQMAKKIKELEEQRANIESRVRAEMEEEIATVKAKVKGVIAALQDQTGTPKEQMRRTQKAQLALAALNKPVPQEIEDEYVGTFVVGEKVVVVGMGDIPMVIESIDERKQSAAVRKNGMRANFPLKKLRPYLPDTAPVKKKKGDHVKFSLHEETRAERAGMKLDLRGMRVEEAVRECELFLDSHYDNGLNSVVIVHGHGTGAVKEAIRSALKVSPYVQSYRSGEIEEGGDGVTVVTLR